MCAERNSDASCVSPGSSPAERPAWTQSAQRAPRSRFQVPCYRQRCGAPGSQLLSHHLAKVLQGESLE